MATVKRESIGNLHEKLVVTLTQEDYLPSFNKKLKQVGKTANIPGFRKGNVPVGMVRKMYGQSLFIDEVLQSANQELDAYLRESKIDMFGQPIALPDEEKINFDMNAAEEFNFAFEIGLKPEFDIKALEDKKGEITYHIIDVTDDVVEKEVENLQRRGGKFEEKEALENDTDVVYADYQACNEEGEVLENTEVQQDVVEFSKLTKKIAEALKGKGADEVLVFKPSEMIEEDEINDFMKSALRQDSEDKEAQNAFYKLTLTKVGYLVIPELNEEFFEQVFPNAGITDEEGFKAKLKEEIIKETNRLSIDRLQNDLFETLVHHTEMEFPVDFLKNWLKKGQEEEKTDEEVEKEFPSFEHQLRWTLISDKLVKEFDIQVSIDEVKEVVTQKVMGYFGITNVEDAPWMDTYLEKMMEEQKTIDETYRQLLFDKLFAAIAEVMQVKEEKISLEEFTKL